MIEGKNGVTANTPKNIMFGAGTIHKGLSFTVETPATYKASTDITVTEGKTYYFRNGTSGNYVYTVVPEPTGNPSTSSYYEVDTPASGGWNFSASLVGATSGGSKLSIVPEITKVEVDGAFVPVKGLSVKTGEAATMEINFIELTKEIIKAATLGADGTSEDSTNYDLIESKSDIESGDYWDNVAFVGKTLEGKSIIAILENALCTSGMELEGKSKEAGIGTYTFESHADIADNAALDTLPWKIYYPKAS